MAEDTITIIKEAENIPTVQPKEIFVKEEHLVLTKIKELKFAMDNMKLEDIQYYRDELAKEINILLQKCSDFFQVVSVLNKSFRPTSEKIRKKLILSKAEGITLARERRIIECLNQNPDGLTASQIASIMSVDIRFISGTVRELLTEGYIQVKDSVKLGDRGPPRRRYILNEERIKVQL